MKAIKQINITLSNLYNMNLQEIFPSAVKRDHGYYECRYLGGHVCWIHIHEGMTLFEKFLEVTRNFTRRALRPNLDYIGVKDRDWTFTSEGQGIKITFFNDNKIVCFNNHAFILSGFEWSRCHLRGKDEKTETLFLRCELGLCHKPCAPVQPSPLRGYKTRHDWELLNFYDYYEEWFEKSFKPVPELRKYSSALWAEILLARKDNFDEAYEEVMNEIYKSKSPNSTT